MAGRAGRTIERVRAFWDSSALAPLCTLQQMSERSLELYARYEVVIWWSTPVELASALGRLARMKQLEDEEWAKAKKAAGKLSASWRAIYPSEALRESAMTLVEQHGLSAGDGLQLAAALEWRGHMAQGLKFFTFDERLRRAALLRGFDTTTA